MSDRATIRYPYRTREGRLRWGRWTGSRAAAFNAGAEALGGLTAHSLPVTRAHVTSGCVEDTPTQPLLGSWAYTDPVTKARWRATTDDVIMLGAALIAHLPEPSERTWRHQELADIAEEQGPLGKLAAAAIGEADRHRPTFDELFDAWAGNTPTRRQLTPKPEDPT